VAQVETLHLGAGLPIGTEPDLEVENEVRGSSANAMARSHDDVSADQGAAAHIPTAGRV